MDYLPEAKSARLLAIYARLLSGEGLNRVALAGEYGVAVRSIQRDIESLRCFLAEQRLPQDVVYDRRERAYKLVNSVPRGLSNSEILAVCKILLESRSMRRDEMMPILDKLIDCCVPEESKRAVTELIANEKHHYVEPHHGKHILDGLWEIGQAVKHRQVMEITYERMKEPRLVSRRVQPVGLMFSEYYFYLTAFLEDRTDFENPDDLFPTIYRLDRIKSFQVLNEHFVVPYRGRFEEGEFRKRVQFMYGGKLQTVKFVYTGPSIESVLDRLPTAEILEEHDGAYTVQAEVFGKGIEMWLRSQGDYIEGEG
ncbi:WYL domain-containing protein [Flavonifractor sp. An10]|uniref:helix-turn-helix transcriptional regulator n=1 Tax=Flavonifractor sp. An10 TaxID=1965537 RepID=UPI001FA927FB|nr:WYL domain-containing protein [Flavonifractor sp. An10]